VSSFGLSESELERPCDGSGWTVGIEAMMRRWVWAAEGEGECASTYGQRANRFREMGHGNSVFPRVNKRPGGANKNKQNDFGRSEGAGLVHWGRGANRARSRYPDYLRDGFIGECTSRGGLERILAAARGSVCLSGLTTRPYARWSLRRCSGYAHQRELIQQSN